MELFNKFHHHFHSIWQKNIIFCFTLKYKLDVIEKLNLAYVSGFSALGVEVVTLITTRIIFIRLFLVPNQGFTLLKYAIKLYLYQGYGAAFVRRFCLHEKIRFTKQTYFIYSVIQRVELLLVFFNPAYKASVWLFLLLYSIVVKDDPGDDMLLFELNL